MFQQHRPLGICIIHHGHKSYPFDVPEGSLFLYRLGPTFSWSRHEFKIVRNEDEEKYICECRGSEHTSNQNIDLSNFTHEKYCDWDHIYINYVSHCAHC
jgi:hypothetical protein